MWIIDSNKYPIARSFGKKIYAEIGGAILTKDEYQEYQDLKKFKADCDKDIKEWDKGIVMLYKPYKWFCSDCNSYVLEDCPHSCDQETLEDIEDGCNHLSFNWKDDPLHFRASICCGCGKSFIVEEDGIHDIETKIETLEDDVRILERHIYGRFGLKALHDKNETLSDRLDDAECEIRQIKDAQQGAWAVQKIKDMNIIRRLHDLERLYSDSDSSSDGEKTLPNKTNKGAKRKAPKRMAKSPQQPTDDRGVSDVKRFLAG